ncbi:MAG: hypothetical protein N2Z71_00660, partial [Caloramator sp.]|nr:hypothetical protein [Caloramator sp.]
MKKSMLVSIIVVYILALGAGVAIGKLYASNRIDNAMAEQIKRDDVNKNLNKAEKKSKENSGDLIDKNVQKNESNKKDSNISNNDDKNKNNQQKEQTKIVS